MRLSGWKNQYQKLVLCFIASGVMLLPLFGCGSRTSAGQQEDVPDAEYFEEKNVPIDGEIVWTLPSGYCDLNQYADKFNQKLAEDGYNFHVVFQYLPENNYQAAIGKRLAEGSTDIAFLGSGSEYDNAVAALIREGNLEELTSFLDSDKGAVLKEFYYEGVWDTVKVDGGIYSFPNQCAISGGDCFVFNTKLFSAEDIEGFDGSLESFERLVDMLDRVDLSQVQYPLICELSLWNAAKMGGYEYRAGTFISVETGEVCNPYETEALRKFMYTMQSLYRKGYFGENGFSYGMDYRLREQAVSGWDFGVWVSGIPDAVFQGMQDEMLCVWMPFSLVSTVNAGTGVSKYAPNKDAALELLSLLYTNVEYGNLLLLGEEGVDYMIEDGGIFTISGERISVFSQERLTGLYDNIYPSEGDLLPVERRRTRFAIYDSDARIDSVILGFQMNTEGFEDLIAKLYEVNEQHAEIWKQEDLESAIREAAEAYRAAGGSQVVEELGRQIGEWLN